MVCLTRNITTSRHWCTFPCAALSSLSSLSPPPTFSPPLTFTPSTSQIVALRKYDFAQKYKKESEEIEIEKEKERKKPAGYWANTTNQVQFLLSLAQHFNLRTHEDWYAVSAHAVVAHGGASLLALYGNSLIRALIALFPHYHLQEWKFARGAQGNWNDSKYAAKYMEWLMKELNFSKMEDFYELTSDMLLKNYGNTLLKKYSNSVIRLVTETLPQHEWQFWRFKAYQKHMWEDKEKCLKYMNWLGEQLTKKTKEDWYSTTVRDFAENYGAPLLKKHGSSPASVIMSVYSSHSWLPWKFTYKRNEIVLSHDLLSLFIQDIATRLGIKNLHDWYNIKRNQIPDSIATIIASNGGLSNILTTIYPTHNWDVQLLAKNKSDAFLKRQQKGLKKVVSTLFPSSEIIEEYIHPTVMSPITQQPLTLDLYVPAHQMGFEFQGQQHYTSKNTLFTSLRQFTSDIEKRKLCGLARIRVTEVPYWWDGTKESLKLLMEQQSVQYVN